MFFTSSSCSNRPEIDCRETLAGVLSSQWWDNRVEKVN
jgi:hypothetical protein